LGSVTGFDWTAFRAKIADYEAFVTSVPTLSPYDFEPAGLRLLTDLYSLGVEMPNSGEVYTQTGGDDVWNGIPVDTEPDAAQLAGYRRVYDMLSERLRGQGRYAPVVDPEVGDEPVYSVLADDLASVLGDLLDGACLYDQNRLLAAMWEWSFSFSHWGEHALHAMTTLHGLVHFSDE
jgi:hypothetical protein